MAGEPGPAPVLSNVALVAQQDDAVGVGIAYGDPERRLTAFEGLTGGCRDIVRGHVVALEAGIHEVDGSPGLPAVIAAINGVAVGRVKTGAGVESENGERFGIGGQQLLILGDGAVSPRVRLPGFGVEAAPHCRFPGFPAVARTVEAAVERAVLILAAHRTVKHQELARGLGTARETLDFLPRQALRLVRPIPAAIIRTPDAPFRGGEDHALRTGAIEVKSEQAAGRSIAGGPCLAGISGEPAAAVARTRKHQPRVGRIDGDFPLERLLEVAEGGKGAATVASEPKLALGGGVEDVRIGGMKGRPALGVAAKLGLVDHAPVVAAVLREVGPAHVAIDHHQVRVCRRNRRREHPAATRQADRLPTHGRRARSGESPAQTRRQQEGQCQKQGCAERIEVRSRKSEGRRGSEIREKLVR